MMLGRFRADATPLTLSDDERRKHLYVAGKTGTGKSTLLKSLILSDLAAGRGFALIDPHGDLAQEIANAIPRARTNDTIYLDPLDAEHAIGFNPLANVPIEERSQAAAAVVSAFKSIWADSWGPRLEYILGNAVRLLLDVPGATLIHLPLVLAQDRYRAELLVHATDPFTRYYWRHEFTQYSERFKNEALAPIQNKVGQFVSNPFLRAILGQPSTIRPDAIINDGKIFIANLSKRMGTEPAHLLGALLTTAFFQAAERRATIPEGDRRDFALIVDEFQNFSTESFGTILSEARKWRLNLVVANQFLGQLPETLRQAVLGNVGSLIVFRVGSEDASLLAAELGMATPATLTDTPNHEAWVKLLRRNVPTEALPMQTILPVMTQSGRLQRVINRTRARYARLRRSVEDTINRLYAS